VVCLLNLVEKEKQKEKKKETKLFGAELVDL